MSRAEALLVAAVASSACTWLNHIDTCDAPRDSDVQVNVSTTGDQSARTARSLVALPSGQYIAAWGSQPSAKVDSPRHLMAVVLSSDGARSGCGRTDHEVQISTATDEIVWQHAVAVGEAEGSAVYFAWRSTMIGTAFGGRIRVRLMRPDLCDFSGDERIHLLSEASEEPAAPSVAVRSDGREALVAWVSVSSVGQAWRIRSRAVGVTVNAFGQVERNGCDSLAAPCTHTMTAQATPPAIAPFEAGYALVWAESRNGLTDGLQVRLELLTAGGGPSRSGRGSRPYGDLETVGFAIAAVGQELLVAHAGEPRDSAEAARELDAEVFLERFAADAGSQGPPIRVNASAEGYQRSPAIALLPDGDLFVTWTTENVAGKNGLYGRVIDVNGKPRFSGLACDATDFAVSSRPGPQQANASLAANGGFMAALFTDVADGGAGGDVDGESVRFRRFDLERLFP